MTITWTDEELPALAEAIVWDAIEIYDGVDLTLELEWHAEPFVRGRYYGPPEHCYPDEGGEIEIVSATATVDGVRHEIDWPHVRRLEVVLYDEMAAIEDHEAEARLDDAADARREDW